MKKFFLPVAFFTIISFSFAQFGPYKIQRGPGEARHQVSVMDQLGLIFANEDLYWQNKDKFIKGSGYKPYSRFKHFWERYYDTGVDPSVSWWQAYADMQLAARPSADNSNWSLVGDTEYTVSGTTEGKGRVNVIAVDPNNPGVIYVGAPAGGLWKTTDGGQTWTPLTDRLPSLGISGIAIHPNDSNTILISTGDDDAMMTPSKGVFKSTDGGQTWNILGTGLSNGIDAMSDIVINPSNPDIILVASTAGIIRSDDGGNSWSIVLNGSSRSLRLHPANHNIVYAITENKFWRSTDAGATWTQVTAGLPSSSQVDRMVMDVTPAAPGRVYVLAMDNDSFAGFFVSNDAGLTFTQTAENDNIITSQQSWYDLEIGVSDTNPDLIFKGELNLMKSTDGGDNFVTINDWSVQNDAYTHADVHFIKYFNGVLYVGTDGGIYRSYDDGVHFENLNNGLAISQFYKISVTKGIQDPLILGGLQDNGGISLQLNSWNLYHGADGMDNVIDFRNPRTGYSFIYYGLGMVKTTDGGITGNWISGLPSYGNWVTPFEISPANEVFAASRSLYKLVNDSWQTVNLNAFDSRANVLKFNPSDADEIFVGAGYNLYRSTNGGNGFSEIHQFNGTVYAVALNPDANDIWVAAGDRVYHSDYGINWTDITAGLPSGVIINDLEFHRFSNPHVIYAATDIGVFRKTGNNNWEPFYNHLPVTIVYDLELDEMSGYLYAGTFGRSVWKTPVDMYYAQWDAGIVSSDLQGTINCSTVSDVTFTVKNSGINTVHSFDYSWHINGETGSATWSGTLAQGQTTDITVSLNNPVSMGDVAVDFEIDLNNDQVATNDVYSTTLLINKDENPVFLYSFESSNDELLTVSSNNNSVWQRAVPNGNVLSSAASGSFAYCTNPSGDYNNETKDYLYLPCLDFSGYTGLMIQFDMAFDIEEDWDALYVEYSTDGISWHVLGTASDPGWYNSSFVQGECIGAQWTGTHSGMQTYSHSLDMLQGEPQVYLRFVMASDAYVTAEGAVIDNLQITGTLGTDNPETIAEVQIYPNPTDDILNVNTSLPVDKMEIIDITGKVIAGLRFNGLKSLQLKTRTLKPGTYLLKIYSGDKIATEYFIKK
jgi:photosystem II stability/assembly factor-like uncharacterized protein